MQSLIKAPTETYTKHLALLVRHKRGCSTTIYTVVHYIASFQRKFAREVPDAKKETYKRFREWLNDYFSPEGPSEEDWEQIMNEDSQHNYLPGVAIDYEISGHEDEVIQQLAQ